LEKLRKDHCIEKFEFVGDDFGNEWDITKLENLEKIDEIFPEIQQNDYSKCLSLLPYEKISRCLNCLNTENLRVHAKASRRFYDLCLKGDFKTVYSQTYEYYRLTEGYEVDQHLNKSVDDFYETHIGKIKTVTEIEISKGVFKKVLEDLFSTWVVEEPELEMNNQLNDYFYVSNFLQKMLESSTSKMLEENSTIKNISEETLKEIPAKIDETACKTLLKDHPELYHDIQEIETYQKITHISCYYFFFKSHILQDFQNNKETSQEKYLLYCLEKSLPLISANKKDTGRLLKDYYEFKIKEKGIYSKFINLTSDKKFK